MSTCTHVDLRCAYQIRLPRAFRNFRTDGRYAAMHISTSTPPATRTAIALCAPMQRLQSEKGELIGGFCQKWQANFRVFKGGWHFKRGRCIWTKCMRTFLGIGIKHRPVTVIGMPVKVILTNGRPCALHVSISLTTDKCRHIWSQELVLAIVRKFDRQTRGQCQTSSR